MHRDSNPVHAMIECSLTRNIYMKHFSTIAPQLFYSFPILVEEKRKIDGIIELLEYSEVAEYLKAKEEDQGIRYNKRVSMDLRCELLFTIPIVVCCQFLCSFAV